MSKSHALLTWLLVACALALPGGAMSIAHSTGADSAQPIYWRQSLLTVPYQWSAGANGDAPKSVSLYVSKDRGASWQQISDAQPQLLAFNYRAEADGEYWFAIRTIDSSGINSSGIDARLVAVPGSASALSPELRVVVDTTMPRFESFRAEPIPDGSIDVRWRIVDANLQAQSCTIESQPDPKSDWIKVPITSASEVSPGVWQGMATLNVAPGSAGPAVRATVVDLAGNRAMYQTPLAASPQTSLGGRPLFPAPNLTAPSGTAPGETVSGWTSSSSPSPTDLALNAPAVSQTWLPDQSAHAPLAVSGENVPTDEPTVTYGVPLASDAALAPVTLSHDVASNIPPPQTDDRPLGFVTPATDRPAEPGDRFRQVSTSRPAPTLDNAATTHLPTVEPDTQLPNLPALVVNSRTFTLEYEIAGNGERGIAKVELWGTHDGGESWQRFAVDDDNRSPLSVTVDAEGEYGFCIVVEGVGSLGGFPPQPGDKPELLVRVDLQPPQAQITSAVVESQGTTRQLVLRWDAADDDLDARPISLFYSSRPAGPWSSLASGLENVGSYSWPLERHVPRRLYLKLEACDVAGNVAAYQTTDPVTIESEPSVAQIRRLPPPGDVIGPLP